MSTKTRKWIFGMSNLQLNKEITDQIIRIIKQAEKSGVKLIQMDKLSIEFDTTELNSENSTNDEFITDYTHDEVGSEVTDDSDKEVDQLREKTRAAALLLTDNYEFERNQILNEESQRTLNL